MAHIKSGSLPLRQHPESVRNKSLSNSKQWLQLSIIMLQWRQLIKCISMLLPDILVLLVLIHTTSKVCQCKEVRCKEVRCKVDTRRKVLEDQYLDKVRTAQLATPLKLVCITTAKAHIMDKGTAAHIMLEVVEVCLAITIKSATPHTVVMEVTTTMPMPIIKEAIVEPPTMAMVMRVMISVITTKARTPECKKALCICIHVTICSLPLVQLLFLFFHFLCLLNYFFVVFSKTTLGKKKNKRNSQTR
jgi:hypothetical protein